MTTFAAIQRFLLGHDWQVEAEQDTLWVNVPISAFNTVIALRVEQLEQAAYVRFDVSFDLYVDEQVLPEVLMGLNLINANLIHCAVFLEEYEAESNGNEILFMISAKGGILLFDISENSLQHLEQALQFFITELNDTIDPNLEPQQHLQA